jgi:hypothetical protein
MRRHPELLQVRLSRRFQVVTKQNGKAELARYWNHALSISGVWLTVFTIVTGIQVFVYSIEFVRPAVAVATGTVGAALMALRVLIAKGNKALVLYYQVYLLLGLSGGVGIVMGCSPILKTALGGPPPQGKDYFIIIVSLLLVAVAWRIRRGLMRRGGTSAMDNVNG